MLGALGWGVVKLPAGGVPFALLIIGLLAILEFYAMLDASHIPHFKVVGTVGGLLLILVTWLNESGTVSMGRDVEHMTLFVVFAACFLRQLFFLGKERAWETSAGTLLGIAYVAFLFNFITHLLTVWGNEQGRYLLIVLVVCVKMTDVGAYTTGCLIGRHKLIPRISPAKTWEGCVGGVIFGIGIGLLFNHLAGLYWPGVRPFTLVQMAVVGGVLSVAGILGDLIESLFKRAAGVKDSGRIILGMGGILDVLDSLLFAAPVLYILTRIINPVA